jgi:hypothetical protein
MLHRWRQIVVGVTHVRKMQLGVTSVEEALMQDKSTIEEVADSEGKCHQNKNR